MKLTVNGQQMSVEKNCNLKELAAIYRLDLSKTIVELNGEIIDKNSADSIKLKEEDKIEFIRFVGGG